VPGDKVTTQPHCQGQCFISILTVVAIVSCSNCNNTKAIYCKYRRWWWGVQQTLHYGKPYTSIRIPASWIFLTTLL